MFQNFDDDKEQHVQDEEVKRQKSNSLKRQKTKKIGTRVSLAKSRKSLKRAEDGSSPDRGSGDEQDVIINIRSNPGKSSSKKASTKGRARRASMVKDGSPGIAQESDPKIQDL